MNVVRRHADWLILLAVMLLAGIVRLGWPGLTEFKADEARLLALAYEMADGRFASRGISSSVGFPNFPLSVWLYAIPAALWRHPLSATLFTGLLNTLAVGGCYLFTRRYWGRAAAVTAALLLAVSPWAILFSRKIWAQNLLPLVVMGWGGSAALAFGEGRRRLVALHLLLLAAAVQIHLAAAALLPATAVLLLLYRRRVDWRWVGVGVLLGVGTAVPFLADLWQNRAAGLLAGAAAGSGVLSLDAFRLTATLSLGLELHSLAGPAAFADYLAQRPPLAPAWAVWGVAMVLGGGVLVLEILKLGDWRPQAVSRSTASLIVILWLLAPPLFFTWHNTPIFVHYFIATLPAQYVAAGVGVGWLWERLAPHAGAARAALGAALGGSALLQLAAFGLLLAFVAQRATPGGFGTPLARQLAAVETAVSALQASDASEILIAGAGEQPRSDAFPAVMGTLLDGVPHRFVDVTRAALFPAAGAVVLLQNGLDAPLAAAYAAAAA
ncbi:MAG: hypothetical protein KC425_15950, partial [Anaerolineales bacterium]|nr:hypothetical protein [Anaerolineales bacterium]